MKRLSLVGGALLTALLACLFLAPFSASAHAQANATQSGSVTQAVTGTAANGATFNGAYTITHFVSQNGQLLGVGTLSGTLTNAAGQVLGTVTNAPVQVPVTSATGTCPVLHLDLGPLNLNLLGLNVNLNQVVLNITAQSGAGNLLGNLLCAVTHLLDGGAPLTSITNLLNQILGLL
ncbi:hypothetical protein [Dictyobacter aurantiacus]|uniref:ABC transporter substrate-binding protein n=1 Tax=Dictyobacter aurantiacus TaxID=1936993 RepID=A0A401ZCY7_9CHLR|nr:hypothetical protein [Dictyobacter aurantiacus]GCE04696.1 hypothetical protein KDAU_20250 [Dictyobacter aurantiacus]